MSIPVITHRDDTGRVKIEDGVIYWKVEGQNILKIAIAGIRAIGEYTTVHAFHKNEWFIVFVMDKEEMFQVSMYARGMTDVLIELAKDLETDFTPRLAEEKDFKSSVIWPLELAGEEFYELRVIKSKSIFDRFRARLGFGNPVELVLKDRVKEWL